MAEFEVKNYDGQLYLKDELKKILNSNPLRALANAKTVVLFPDDISLEAVRNSLEVLLMDVDLRIKFVNEKVKLEERQNSTQINKDTSVDSIS